MALKFGKLFGGEKANPADVELDMPTTQVKMGQAAAAYDPLASVSIMEQLRTRNGEHDDAEEAAAHRPPAGRQAVPDARHPARHVPRVRGADGVPRQPPVRAGRRRRGDRDGNADAVAAARPRQRACRAGPGDGVRGGQGQPRSLQGRPRRAAERRHRPRREPRRRAGRSGRQAPERRQAAVGARRRGGRAPAGERDEPDVAGQGPRGAQRRQQRAAGTGADGGRADRAGRRVAARDRVREPARRAVAADREERQHARVVGRNRPRGRVPARPRRRHVPRHPQRAAQGQRRAAPPGGAQRRGARARWPSCRSASARTKAASTRS